ncbi:hypothetical protein PG985_006270 [Apiospora marii]|uniref:Cytochrome c oxidase-assembly factor COX23, mitochondrial n=1 Tax=Apiospora marii TaxID=335849 RepID=A0ABR1S8X2_9PEZI
MSTQDEPAKDTKVGQEGPKGKDGKDPWSKENKNKFQNKSRSEYFDPCQEAAERSIRCLNRNGGDRKMCSDYFEPQLRHTNAGLTVGQGIPKLQEGMGEYEIMTNGIPLLREIAWLTDFKTERRKKEKTGIFW